MSKDLEQALSKLRFDDQVLGYSLMTRIGRPFVSFAFPDELFPRVKDSIKLYKADLRLMTIDTEKGLVVLSPVDENWILTVLYVTELQLGLAIAKTKNVLRLLEGIQLPPPPEDFEESSELNMQVLESIAIKASSVESSVLSAPLGKISAPAPNVPAKSQAVLSPKDFAVSTATVPERGPEYSNSLLLDSPLYNEMKGLYRNFGFDVLMLVDGGNSVETIADSMFQPADRIVDFLKWSAAKGVIVVPRAEEIPPAPSPVGARTSAGAPLGRFVKCPRFEGDLSKVAGDDIQIIKMCNGRLTAEQIAETANLPFPKVVQILAKYRKAGLKMIGRNT